MIAQFAGDVGFVVLSQQGLGIKPADTIENTRGDNPLPFAK